MKTYCNLLPTRLRRRRILHDRLQRWGSLTVMVLLGLSALAAYHWRSHRSAHTHLANVRTATEELRTLIAESGTRAERLVDVRGQLAARERVIPTEDTLHVLDLVGRGHRRTLGRLSVSKLTVERQRVEGVSTVDPAKKESRETTRVEVIGVALDDAVISRFVTALRGEAPDGRIELQSGVKVDVEGREVRKYFVTALFE